MARFVGLDIGTHTVTGAVFTGKPGNFRLIDFFVEEIPKIDSGGESSVGDELGTPASLDQVLERIVQERRLQDAEVVTALDTQDCVLREFGVPFVRDEQIAKTIHFEAESHFPGVDFEDVTIDYVKVDESEGRSRLAAWAVQNSVLERRIALTKEHDVDPVVVSVDAAALFNAFALSPLHDPERTSLIVDMGRTSTRFVLVEKGRLRKARALRIETRAFDAGRMVPASADDGADAITSDGAPEVAVEIVGEGDLSLLFDEKTIEARFREIEEALQRLEPGPAESAEDRSGGESVASEEESELAELGDAPIAILSDDDYDLVREEEHGDGVDGELAGVGEDDERALARSVSDGGPDAADRAKAGGSPFVAHAERGFDRRKYLEQVALEIQRFVVGLRLERPVELICVTGGMAADPDTARFLERELDVETVALDFGDAISTGLDVETRALAGKLGAVAVGLGARALGRDLVGIDFRQGRFRYEHKFEKLRLLATAAAVLFVFVSLQAVFWSILEWKEEKQRFESYTAYSAQTFQEFFGRPPKPGLSPLIEARGQQRNWAGLGRDSRYINVVEAVQNVAEILDGAKSPDYGFVLKGLDLKLQAKLPRSATNAGPGGPSPGGPTPAGPRPASRRAPALKVAKSTMILETTDPRFLSRLDPAFRGPKSQIFDASFAQSGGRGRQADDLIKLTIDLTPKESKLRELQ